jgi:hypothetical protein
MPGTKTSVWLGEDLITRWKASGLSLTDLVRRGLDADATNPAPLVTLTEDATAGITAAVTAAVREEFDRERRRAGLD